MQVPDEVEFEVFWFFIQATSDFTVGLVQRSKCPVRVQTLVDTLSQLCYSLCFIYSLYSSFILRDRSETGTANIPNLKKQN